MSLQQGRIGLVLGAGGVAGIAFHAGVLAALAEALEWDARSAALVVGTSAGSVTGSGLRAGIPPRDLLARMCGEPLSDEGARVMARADAATGRGAAGDGAGRLPSGMPADARVLLAAGRRPWRVRPGAVVAGLLPAGRVPTAAIESGVDALFGDQWPDAPTWICALRLDTGHLTVFGRRGTAPARMGQAVAASCAIPGYFAPVTIDGVRYVDGGAHSLTNLAKVRREPLDLVVVSAPMARAGARRPGLGALGREYSRLQLGVEARAVRGHGVDVIAFAPTATDQAVMGGNPMDRSRQGPIARQAYESTLRRLERGDVRARLAALGA
jgi:NTE family protein